jgi:hypothetical protein
VEPIVFDASAIDWLPFDRFQSERLSDPQGWSGERFAARTIASGSSTFRKSAKTRNAIVPDKVSHVSKVAKGFQCSIREKTTTVFRSINSGDVAKRRERAGLLKALRIERNRPTRPQREG